MAQVPQNTGPQVMPQGVQPGQNIPVDPEAFGTGVGRAVQGVGAAVGQMGDVLAAHAQTMMALEQNAVADVHQQQFTANADRFTLDMKDKAVGINATQDTYDKYLQELEDMRAKGKEGLSPFASRLYDQETRRASLGFQNTMATQIHTERTKFIKTTAADSINSAAAIYAQNPTEENFQTFRDNTHKNAGIISSLEGDEPTKLESNTISRGVADAIKQKAISDPPAAQAYYNDHKEHITNPSDILEVERTLHTASIPYYGAQVSKGVWANYDTTVTASGVPPTADKYPPEVTGAVTSAASKYHVDPNVVLRAAYLENGGNVNPKSNGSSTGFFQLQDSAYKEAGGTGDRADLASNIEAGVKEFAIKGADLKTRLGRTITGAENYLAMQQGAAGAAALIKAAPGMKAIDAIAPYYKTRDLAEQAITGNGGTANMSAAQFVQTWSQRFGGSQSAGDQLAQLDASHKDIIDQVRAQVASQYHGDYQIEERAVQEAEKEFNLRHQILTQAASASQQSLTQALISDPASQHYGPTSQSELFAMPGMQAQYDNLTGTEQKRVQTWLDSNAHAKFKGEHPSMSLLLATRPEVEANYREVQGESISDPGKFASRNLWTDPRTQGWPVQELNKLQLQQDKIRKGSFVDPTVERARQWATPQLKDAGIDPATDTVRYNQFVGALKQNVQTYADEYGKAPDQPTVRNWITQMLVEQGHGFGKPSTRAFEDRPESFGAISGVPNDAASQLIAYGRSKGVSYSPAQIQQIYSRAKGKK